MRKISLTLLAAFLSIYLIGQTPMMPQEWKPFTAVSSYEAIKEKVTLLDEKSDFLEVEVIGKSVQGRQIYALKFSKTEFGGDPSKIKVLLFAQQHGNEQSGKEGALLLVENLLEKENEYLFDKMDLAIIPQVNPDGAEINQRRNSNEADLNRNHLILTEPETQALHQFFNTYHFEVSMDVHEYSPYSDSWLKYGYRKNTDVTIGGTTNINVAKKIRDLSNKEALPYMQKYIQEAGFSSFTYCPGGPPESDYLRYSTFDINDGRQSLGIQNTLSFIQEGMNGEDSYLENMQKRAYGQMTGMIALLDYVYHHQKKIIKLIGAQRKKLLHSSRQDLVAVQMEHVKNGKALHLPVLSLKTGQDSTIVTQNFHPVVQSISEVDPPLGYLVPKDCKKIIDWCKRQELIIKDYIPSDQQKIVHYDVIRVDSIDFEGDIIVNPQVEARVSREQIKKGDNIFIPLDQLKSHLIVQALEPKSMLGLITYASFQDLLRTGHVFPVSRVEKK